MLRQSILIRTDLGFSTGLYAAQVAHCHFEPMRRYFLSNPRETETEEFQEWVKSPYIFVHAVPNKESLDYFYQKALAAETPVPVVCWYDTVEIKVSATQKIVVSKVWVGITLGVAESDRIREIIGDLPLLGNPTPS